MKKQIIWIITVFILVALLLITMNYKKPEADANAPPSLPLDEVLEEVPTSSYYLPEEDLTPFTSTNILGTWKAVSEQTGIDGIVNNNLKNSEITFSENGVFTSSTFGIPELGYYELEDNQIFFYNSEEDSVKQGSFLIALGGIRDNTLRLTFPQFPKTVVYEKVER